MKNRILKKIVAMFLTCIISICTLIIPTSAAEQTSTHSVNWTLSGNETATGTKKEYIYAGDKLNVTMTVNRDVDVGFVHDSGRFWWWSVKAGSSFNLTQTMNRNEEGMYRFRIRNKSSLPLSVSGTWSYTRTYNNRISQIAYDSTCRYTSSQLETQFNYAADGFVSRFNLHPVLWNNVRDDSLNGGGCNKTICDAGCGNPCNTGHHEGGMRLINRMMHVYNARTIGVVGHDLCYGTGTGHGAVLGVAQFINEGNQVIVTSKRGDLADTMQHELSHNLGVANHCNGECVMNVNVPSGRYTNRWCTTHYNQINGNRQFG